ncbi:uncharacterized protein LOC142639774 [Castanea sativa]|uniref:uncharacterized protein LOC142639774 n=1 Tax=Castanea sativa TaxID=21020 RepID=UPI003F6544C7
MGQIDKYKWVEKDQQQGNGKVKVIPQDRRHFRLEMYNSNWPRRDFAGHAGLTTAQVVNTVFREYVYQILEKIKNEPYFKWPYKMGGGPMKKSKSSLPEVEAIPVSTHWAKESGWINTPNGCFLKTTLGTISVILAPLGRTGSYPSRVMSIAMPHTENLVLNSKRGRMKVQPALSFFDEDKVGTFQLYDDALVVTLQIRGIM